MQTVDRLFCLFFTYDTVPLTGSVWWLWMMFMCTAALCCFYFVPGQRANCRDHCVHMSVCLSVHSRVSKTTCPYFNQMFCTCYLWPCTSAYQRIISNDSYAHDEQGDNPGQVRGFNGVLDRCWCLDLQHQDFSRADVRAVADRCCQVHWLGAEEVSVRWPGAEKVSVRAGAE